MMQALIPALFLLAGCAAVDTSYSLGQGIASYDDLRRATEECSARGGSVRPSGQGDPSQLSSYICVIPRGS